MYTEETVVTNQTTASPVHQVRREVVMSADDDTVMTPHAYAKKKTLFRAYQVLWYVLGVVEVLLMFRIFLKAVGANQASGFANFIYTVSDSLALPFSGVLGVSSTGAAVLEWPTFIAMAVYAIAVYGIIMLLQLGKPTNPQEVVNNVDTV